MPETLVESELFGALRGAYTGADRDRPGLFEAAHRGTLFLDEIVEMPLPIQAKMLRAIQEKEIRRLGDTVSRPIDVRIVSASHGSLEENVAKGRFREDLYYRIGMTVVRIPPLRERGDDLAMLIGQFLAEIGREAGTTPTLTAEAKRLLLAHPWPGNVRELVNTLRGAAALAGGGRIGAAQLPAALRTRRIAKAGGPSLPERVREERKREIEAALVSSGGNVTKAATLLGVTRQAVHHDVVRLGIDVASFRPRKK
jgi:transcriptional regulator with PAS, ATPase and Fis domain